MANSVPPGSPQTAGITSMFVSTKYPKSLCRTPPQPAGFIHQLGEGIFEGAGLRWIAQFDLLPASSLARGHRTTAAQGSACHGIEILALCPGEKVEVVGVILADCETLKAISGEFLFERDRV